MNKDENIRAKALEISALILGPASGLEISSAVDQYLLVAGSVEKYIRQGIPTEDKK
jgi:hypothetical protein